ncbi:MAG: NHL repeat-containing protein [SAR202 cluster bacterium]|jgi:DNA-binding beta-propeller fold protein YncE|nr:NHL repeat-containing protein [SAR202 cluster bacterium]
MSTSTAEENKPFGLLRAGFPFLKTIGMRRITNYPYDVAIENDDRIYILLRSTNVALIRVWFFEDAERLPDTFEDIGAYGKEDGQFISPVCVVLDPEGNIVVSDESLNRISFFSRGGEFLKAWGISGSNPGELDGPSGIAFNNRGNLLVSDAKNHRIQEFDSEGKVLNYWGNNGDGPGELNKPWGIDVDDSGDVFVSDWGNDRISKFGQDGEFIFSFGSSGDGKGMLDGPSGIAVDKYGDVFVADTGNDRVQLFNKEGRYVQEFIGDATLAKCARDYMLTNAGSNRLRDMADLEVQKRLRNPRSVAIDEKGRLYIPDYRSFRVQIYQNEVIPLDETQFAKPRRSRSLLQE